MSRLGDEIRRRMGARESKELLAEYVEALGGAESPGPSTFSPKLSKLLSGDPEGERYFLEKPARSRALEQALGVEPGWLAAQRQVRVLVLDPGLHERAKTYLKEREEQAAGAFACRDVSLEGLPEPVARKDVLARMREVAEREPGALVIAMDRADAMYFEGAKLVWTCLERHPRGFILEAEPELVALPGLFPPLLVGERGAWLMPHPEFEVHARREAASRHSWDWERERRLQAPDRRPECPADGCLFQSRRDGGASEDLEALHLAITQADRVGRTASFPVRQVLALLLSCEGIDTGVVTSREQAAHQRLLWFPRHSDSRALAERVQVMLQRPEPAQQTILWEHGEQLLGWGSLRDQVVELLAPHHELGQPGPLLRWKEAIETWNPWRDQRQLLLPPGDNYFCRWIGRADGLCDGAELRLRPGAGARGAPDGHRQAGPLAEEEADGRQDVGGGRVGRRDEREDGAHVAARAAAVGDEGAAHVAHAA